MFVSMAQNILEKSFPRYKPCKKKCSFIPIQGRNFLFSPNKPSEDTKKNNKESKNKQTKQQQQKQQQQKKTNKQKKQKQKQKQQQQQKNNNNKTNNNNNNKKTKKTTKNKQTNIIGIYGGKIYRPFMGTKLKILHDLNGGQFFSKIFCPILSKSQWSFYLRQYSTLLLSKLFSL